jgi:ubiquinone/menaquinone biosynthesis C-methylase UbiE
LHRRAGGDVERFKSVLTEFLYPVRDRVLSHANLKDGGTLLDVGCGDGLIAFGALEKVPHSRIIFSDISQDLLDHSRALAREMQVSQRCEFLRASADDLQAVADESVDAVTIRSVLIYVPAKGQAFHEFFRVLKPGGSLSIFEPINRFGWPEPPHLFSGYDVTPVMEIADKLKELYNRLQPPDTDPMLDFDERDLIVLAENAGFREIHLELEAHVKPPTVFGDWQAFIRFAANPRVPALEEAMNEALTAAEIEKLTAHLRPLVDAGQGTSRSALAYLWAVKN